jgi:beta-N-acetylhexosaminidase
LREARGPGLHVAVDQEHGLVVRFDRELTVFPGAMALGATGVREPSLAEFLSEACARRAGEELAAIGVDVNLAPVCDLATRGDNPGLGVRSFSSHAKLAGRLVAATVRGHAAAGVASTLKHFPGLGGAESDSHLDLPRARVGRLEELLEPFAAGVAAGAACVMSTHCDYPELDDAAPATFSARIQRGLLRERLGFEGVLVTDDLEMGAMSKRYGFDEVVTRAAPFHDVLCLCSDPEKQRRAHALLAEALERGGADAASFASAEERLTRLATATAAARRGATIPLAPDVDSQRLADAVAGRATTVVRDPAGLLPLAPDEPVLAILPPLGDLTPVEDPLRGESLDELVGGLPAGSVRLQIPREPDAADVLRVLETARGFRRVLLGTTLARFRPAEAAAARAIVARHPGVVWIALRNPFDFEVAPSAGGAALVTTYGFRPVHQRALLAVLYGRVEPYGRLPVELVSV